MENGDVAMSGLILAGRGILVEMLVTFNGMFYMYFDHFFHFYPYNIVVLNLEKKAENLMLCKVRFLFLLW